MTNSDQQLQQELEQLKKEYGTLRDRKLRAEEALKSKSEQLSELEQKAEQEYGTSDPERLTALLEEKRAENSKLVADYRAHLEGVKASLAQVQKETLQK